MSLSFRSSASGGTAEMVPRQLLLDSQDAVERLRRQLDEALANQDSEVNVAVHTLQAQLRAVQKQQKAAETQLSRSLAREKELRDQVVNADVMSAMGSLRKENKELRERNEKLSEQATKGQEGEAHLIVLRNKLDASQEEVQRLRSGNELELQSTREEVASLKKALEKAQIDMINSEQVLRREKEMQEAIDRSAVLLNEKDRQVPLCGAVQRQVRCGLGAPPCACGDGMTPVRMHRFLNCKTNLIGQALLSQLLRARHIPGGRRSQTSSDRSDTKRGVQRR
jgi:chromosome segregation ATPase